MFAQILANFLVVHAMELGKVVEPPFFNRITFGNPVVGLFFEAVSNRKGNLARVLRRNIESGLVLVSSHR